MLDTCSLVVCFFFFKQKTAYVLRISDWSSDVCSSDLDMYGEAKSADNPKDASGLMKSLLGNPAAVESRFNAARAQLAKHRSEERRVGQEGVSTCSSRGSPHH